MAHQRDPLLSVVDRVTANDTLWSSPIDTAVDTEKELAIQSTRRTWTTWPGMSGKGNRIVACVVKVTNLPRTFTLLPPCQDEPELCQGELDEGVVDHHVAQ